MFTWVLLAALFPRMYPDTDVILSMPFNALETHHKTLVEVAVVEAYPAHLNQKGTGPANLKDVPGKDQP